MTEKVSNGSFARVSMWVIGLLVGALIFLGGRETVNRSVRANESAIGIHEVKIERVEKDIVELEQDIKDGLKDLQAMIRDIHKIIMEE